MLDKHEYVGQPGQAYDEHTARRPCIHYSFVAAFSLSYLVASMPPTSARSSSYVKENDSLGFVSHLGSWPQGLSWPSVQVLCCIWSQSESRVQAKGNLNMWTVMDGPIPVRQYWESHSLPAPGKVGWRVWEGQVDMEVRLALWREQHFFHEHWQFCF